MITCLEFTSFISMSELFLKPQTICNKFDRLLRNSDVYKKRIHHKSNVHVVIQSKRISIKQFRFAHFEKFCGMKLDFGIMSLFLNGFDLNNLSN